ncbi:hypothetical protein G6514_005232 [Epicoccum nigrum]|nr:hypothetical protein G6514_005232 [Epicoccum nigrum]
MLYFGRSDVAGIDYIDDEAASDSKGPLYAVQFRQLSVIPDTEIYSEDLFENSDYAVKPEHAFALSVPNKGQLKKSVDNWKDFQSKGVGKKIAKKESMFRKSSAFGSTVGFTGSGLWTRTPKTLNPGWALSAGPKCPSNKLPPTM